MRCITPALFVGFMLAAAPAYAQGHSIRQGVLTCRTSASIGLIVGSRQRLRCQFRSDRGWTQNYTAASAAWVLTSASPPAASWCGRCWQAPPTFLWGALAGDFVGASGDVSVGVGAGANLLVGGTRRSVSLQPLSLEGQVGVNLALGVARMTLVPVR